MKWCQENKLNLNLHEFSSRLKTFKNWNSAFKKSPEELAYHGFIYVPSQVAMDSDDDDNDNVGGPQTKNDDNVMCVYCGIEIHMWETNDHPMLEHKRVQQDCTQFKPL